MTSRPLKRDFDHEQNKSCLTRCRINLILCLSKVSWWYFYPVEISLESEKNTQQWIHRITQGGRSENNWRLKNRTHWLNMGPGNNPQKEIVHVTVKWWKGREVCFPIAFLCCREWKWIKTAFYIVLPAQLACLINRDISLFFPRALQHFHNLDRTSHSTRVCAQRV